MASSARSEGTLRVLSYGGGTQSAALALMSAAGQLPKLDAVVFADTGGELPGTYEYADYVEAHLDEAGIPFHRISAGNLEQALLSQVPVTNSPTPPLHLKKPDGTQSRINKYRCTYEYKRRIITAHIKKLCGPPGAWKRMTVEQWMGFSTDEAQRCKPDIECRCGHPRVRRPHKTTGERRGHTPGCTELSSSRSSRPCGCEGFDPWRVNTWPLIDQLDYRREDTIQWFTDNGHPVPVRSACWFCPNSSGARWAELRDQHPDLFERACNLDEALRHGGPFQDRGNGSTPNLHFLHRSAIPLRDAALDGDAGPELLDIGASCEDGACFT